MLVGSAEEDLGRALFARVVRGELQRRLPKATVRCFAGDPYAHPHGLDGGEPLEPLQSWSGERASAFADQLDCAVVAEGDDRSARFSMEVGIRNVEVIPDPVQLVARHVSAEVREKRLAYLRLMEWYPEVGNALVVQGDDGITGSASGLAKAIAALVQERPATSVVVAELSSSRGSSAFAEALEEALREALQRQPYRLPSEVEVEDVIAAVAAAGGFIGTSVYAGRVAMAHGRPFVLLDFDERFDRYALEWETGGVLVAENVETVDQAFERAEPPVGPPVLPSRLEELDRHFDRVAEIAAGAARRRGGVGIASGSEVEARLAALRTAHEVLGRRAVVDRVRSAELVASARARIADLEEQLRSIRSKRLYRLYRRVRRWVRFRR